MMEVFENDDSGINKMERKIKRKFSPGLNIQDCNEFEDRVVFNLSMTYDNIIEENDKVSLKHITLRDIANFSAEKLEDGGKLKPKYPDVGRVIDSFLKKRKSYIRTMEKILAIEGSNKFIRIPRIKNHLHPYLEIFNNLEMEEKLELNNWKNWRRNEEKAEEYLKLLEDHRYIRREGNKILKGEKLKIADDKRFENEEMPKTEQVLEDFFKTAYSNLRSAEKGATNIAPYFEVANASYFTSVLNEEPTKQTSEEIKSIYNRLSGKDKLISQIRDYLMELVNYGILNREDNHFSPNRDLLERFKIEENQRQIHSYIR